MKKLRNTQHKYFRLHNCAVPSQKIFILEEVLTFKYLGLLLDQSLSLVSALTAALKSFWFAHSQLGCYGAHVHGLHPKHQILLWKQLALSRLHTCLSFMYDPHKHTHRINHAITTSLAYTFFQDQHAQNAMHIPLRTELGIPSAQTLMDINTLRLHIHLCSLPPHISSFSLYRILQNAHALLPSNTSYLLSVRAHLILNKLHMPADWLSPILTLPSDAKLKNPLSLPHTKRRWINIRTHSFAALEYEQLRKWGSTHHNFPAPQLGRAQTYLLIAENDLQQRLRSPPHTRSCFQPCSYITFLKSSSLTLHLLHVRCQSSQLPIHVPFLLLHKRVRSVSRFPLSRTPYSQRFCPFCLPPPDTWNLLLPPADSPLGTEHHIFFECSSFLHLRDTSFTKFDENLRKMCLSFFRPNSLHPWFSLTSTTQLPLLLASPPPAIWKLPYKELPKWYAHVEPLSHAWLHVLLPKSTDWLSSYRSIFS